MLDQSKLAEVFGIEMADAAVPDLRANATLAKKTAPARKLTPKKKAPAKKNAPARKINAIKRNANAAAPKRVASVPKRKLKLR